MNETVPFYAFVVLFVLSIGAIAVAKIINTKSVLGETPDFITAAIRRRREKLGEYTTGVTFRVYCFLLIALPIIFGAAGFLLSNSGAIALIAGLLGVFIPDLIIVLTAKRQGKKFETRYARCLKALTSCLRTTMSISQAVEDVAKNPFLDAKIRAGFEQISADLKVGISTEEAFQRFADRTGSPDAQDVAAAISMQMRVGGSEAKIMESIATNIQDRIMLRKEIQSVFAEMDVVIRIMDIAPLIGLFIMCAILPEFTRMYFESMQGFLLLAGIIAFSFVGSIIIHRQTAKAKRGDF